MGYKADIRRLIARIRRIEKIKTDELHVLQGVKNRGGDTAPHESTIQRLESIQADNALRLANMVAVQFDIDPDK